METGNWKPQQEEVILNSPDGWLGTDLDACPLHSTTAGSRSHHGLGLPIMPRESRERKAGPLRWEVNCLRGQFSEIIQKKSPPIRGLALSIEVSGRLAREAMAFQSRGCPALAALKTETWDATLKNGPADYLASGERGAIGT